HAFGFRPGCLGTHGGPHMTLKHWLAAGTLLGIVVGLGAIVGTEDRRLPTNATEFEKMFQEVSNWGRWGKDDQLGTANLVTAAKRKQAAALVKSGEIVSLSHNLVTEKGPDNPNPFIMTNKGNTYTFTYHSTTHSHIDALCHMAYKGK